MFSTKFKLRILPTDASPGNDMLILQRDLVSGFLIHIEPYLIVSEHAYVALIIAPIGQN